MENALYKLGFTWNLNTCHDVTSLKNLVAFIWYYCYDDAYFSYVKSYGLYDSIIPAGENTRCALQGAKALLRICKFKAIQVHNNLESYNDRNMINFLNPSKKN